MVEEQVVEEVEEEGEEAAGRNEDEAEPGPEAPQARVEEGHLGWGREDVLNSNNNKK